MNQVPLEARRLGKAFGISPVLRAVDLKVEQGEGSIVVGRNGSGKSTLMRILAGLSSASTGEALLFGQPANHLPAADRRRIGVVSHQSFLHPRLTARENLEFYSELYHLEHRAIRVGELLERLGLAPRADERVSTFSRGMEQRLALARAVISSPDVLLMDEPFAALDVEGVGLVVGLIRDALDRGCATLITAHEQVQFPRLVLTSYELERGRLYNAKGRSDIQGPGDACGGRLKPGCQKQGRC
jgi:heme exporter protein A